MSVYIKTQTGEYFDPAKAVRYRVGSHRAHLPVTEEVTSCPSVEVETIQERDIVIYSFAPSVAWSASVKYDDARTTAQEYLDELVALVAVAEADGRASIVSCAARDKPRLQSLTHTEEAGIMRHGEGSILCT